MSIPATIDGLPPIHPGTLLCEIVEDLAMSRAELARLLDVPPRLIQRIAREQAPVTAELALRFGRCFGQTPQFWMDLQTTYDLKLAETRFAKALRNIKPLVTCLAQPIQQVRRDHQHLQRRIVQRRDRLADRRFEVPAQHHHLVPAAHQRIALRDRPLPRRRLGAVAPRLVQPVRLTCVPCRQHPLPRLQTDPVFAFQTL